MAGGSGKSIPTSSTSPSQCKAAVVRMGSVFSVFIF